MDVHHAADVLFGLLSASTICCECEDQRPSTDRHRSPLRVVAMTNQRRDLRSEDALQAKDLRSKTRGHPRDRDRRGVDPSTTTQRRNGEDVEPSAHVTDATGDAETTVKTVLYDKRSESRGAEVSGPVLMLIGLTVELEQDNEETRR